MPYFVEFKHLEDLTGSKDALLLFDRVEVSRMGNFTCPVKSLAFFAHN